MKECRLWVLAVSVALSAGVAAEQFVYPAKGQSPDQQKKDEGECYSWAVKQSGFDPAKPPPPPPSQKQQTTASGTTPGAGARGAARGAVVGEIVADDAKAGAAAGAVAARSQSRRQNVAAEDQAQKQYQSSIQQKQASFSKARAACLEGKGYTVK